MNAMKTPGEEWVAREFVRRMKHIREASGHETDIGSRVLWGRVTPDASMMPCCTLIEGEAVYLAEGLSKAQNSPLRTVVRVEKPYALMAYVSCDPDNPNIEAHKALRDLKKAVFTEGVHLGSLIFEVKPLSTSIGARADGSRFVLAVLEVLVTQFEDLARPEGNIPA